MDPLLVVLRLVHILAGTVWVGTVIFTATLLLPAVGDAGPDGGKVMAALQRRRMLDILPVLALLTLVSGFWMYFRLSGGSPDFARSRLGMVLGGGGALALVAFLLGVLVMRPSVLRVGNLMATAGGLPEGAERASLMAEAQRLRQRSAAAGRVVAGLLAVTTILMAIARYL